MIITFFSFVQQKYSVSYLSVHHFCDVNKSTPRCKSLLKICPYHANDMKIVRKMECFLFQILCGKKIIDRYSTKYDMKSPEQNHSTGDLI